MMPLRLLARNARRVLVSVTAIALLWTGACTQDVQLAPRAQGVGAPCASDQECPTNLCHVRGPGYCTAACLAEGDTAGCPADSVCKPIQGDALRCLIICGHPSICGAPECPADACPSGSNCVVVGTGGLRACEPTP